MIEVANTRLMQFAFSYIDRQQPNAQSSFFFASYIPGGKEKPGGGPPRPMPSGGPPMPGGAPIPGGPPMPGGGPKKPGGPDPNGVPSGLVAGTLRFLTPPESSNAALHSPHTRLAFRSAPFIPAVSNSNPFFPAQSSQNIPPHARQWCLRVLRPKSLEQVGAWHASMPSSGV